MKLTWRYCSEDDVVLLADWNHQLIRDEGARNPMTIEELAKRMQDWLSSEYQAVLFSNSEPVAYALFRKDRSEIYLRQLFVRRDKRRTGIGHAAMEVLRREIWPSDIRLTVEVLCSNTDAARFWRSVGYRDYSIALEILPEKGPNQSPQPTRQTGG